MYISSFQRSKTKKKKKLHCITTTCTLLSNLSELLQYSFKAVFIFYLHCHIHTFLMYSPTDYLGHCNLLLLY